MALCGRAAFAQSLPSGGHISDQIAEPRSRETRVSVSQLGPMLFPDGTSGTTSLRMLNPQAQPVAAQVAGETITIAPGEIVERMDLAGTVVVQAEECLFVTSRSSDRAFVDALDARHDVQSPARDLRSPRVDSAMLAQDVCSPAIVLSTASLACKFGTSTAAVEPTPGATYAWAAQNASITSGLGTNAVTLAFGGAANASISVSVVANGCTSAGAASITLRDPFQIATFLPDTPSPRVGDRVTLRWSYSTADAPKTQTLTITAAAGAPSAVKLSPGDRSYSFVVDRIGTWSAELNASLFGGRRRAVRSGTSTVPPPSPCAADVRTAIFVVGAACDNPEATVSGGGQACAGDRVAIRADFTGTPPFSGQWSDGATFTTDASFVMRTVASSGSYSLISFSDATCSGSSNGHAAVTIKPAPAISAFTVPTSVGPGQSGTISFAYSNGTSFALSSSLRNSFSTCCGTSTTGGTVTYNRDNAVGPDTITLTVTGPCGTTSDTRVINDPPPVITNFTSSPTAIAFGEAATLHFTIQNGSTWTLSSSIGNAFSQPSGTGSGAFTITYSAAGNVGIDTATLRVNGPGGAASATVDINVGVPVITSFAASPTTIELGGTSTLNFTMQNGGNSSWHLSSSIGNTFSQSSGGNADSFTITYSASHNTGTDTVTLQTMGEGFTRSATVTITVK